MLVPGNPEWTKKLESINMHHSSQPFLLRKQGNAISLMTEIALSTSLLSLGSKTPRNTKDARFQDKRSNLSSLQGSVLVSETISSEEEKDYSDLVFNKNEW